MALEMHTTENNLPGIWENTRVTNIETRFSDKNRYQKFDFCFTTKRSILCGFRMVKFMKIG